MTTLKPSCDPQKPSGRSGEDGVEQGLTQSLRMSCPCALWMVALLRGEPNVTLGQIQRYGEGVHRSMSTSGLK